MRMQNSYDVAEAHKRESQIKASRYVPHGEDPGVLRS